MKIERFTLVVSFALAHGFVPRASAAERIGRCEVVVPLECLQVTVEGAGPDVVLVPGLFGSSFGFRRLVPLLVDAGHRTVVIEPLGVGFSSRPAEADYSFSAQARRISTVLDRMGVKRAVLVSHSVGTAMALRLALLDPERVGAIVSIEGGPVEEVTTPGFRRAMRLAPLLKLLGPGRVIKGRVRGMLQSRSGDPSWVTDAVVDGYSAGPARDLDATLDAFSRMARAREPEALRPRLSEVRCPVWLLLGQAPHEGGPTDAEIATFRSGLQHFTLSNVPGAGNFIFEEAPQAIVRIVQEMTTTAGRAALEGYSSDSAHPPTPRSRP